MGGNLLEVLILRDCMHLKEVRAVKFALPFCPKSRLSFLKLSRVICRWKLLDF